MKQFMRAASHLATKRASEELYKMEGFYRKKGGARELLHTKGKITLRPGLSFGGEGNGKKFYHADWGQRVHMTDYLPGA